MFQEIRMPRKSLREVLPKKSAAMRRSVKEVVEPELENNFEEEEKAWPSPRFPETRRAPRSGKMIWLVIFLVVFVAAGFLVSKSLATVLVEINPKQAEVALNGSEFFVPYESVTIPALSESQTVTVKTGTGTPKKASGIITIYNEYSESPQTLIATTRFQTPEGKVYRIDKSVVVPGMKKVAGKNVPGAVEATVYADKTGSDYNTGLTKFSIPGFKGDPRFDKFYAKSKTSMAGGSSGQEKSISEADRAKLISGLKQSLIRKAAEQIRFQIPENFVLYESAILPTWEESLGPTEASSDQATFTLSASAQALIFERSILSKALASQALPVEIKDQPFRILNLESLAISLDSDAINKSEKKVRITAQGGAKVLFVVDPSSLATQLAGKEQAEAQAIFQGFPAIAEAKVSFRPPWIRAFPEKVDRIKVVDLTQEAN